MSALAIIRVPNVWRLCGIPHKRHRFAINTLLDWHRAGVDIQARLPWLSTYMGHTEPANTFYYLTATPELLGLVAQRLEPALEGNA